jgi:bifunctional non-homologous end joining protein LigD
VADPLDEYRRKRDPERTPEPGAGQEPGGDRDGGPRFVIQEHHSTSLHWDLRLERDGVLVSWAVPKGLPPDPRQNNLAVHVEDHPLDYADFEGEIPAGSYGAGRVTIWDRGTYETHTFRDDEVMVTLHGERVEGKYVLFRTRGQDWMVHRMDPPSDPDWEPLPEAPRPMLACLADDLPEDESAYGFEVKWDGVRALVLCEGGRCRALNRTGGDITARYPELRALGRALGSLSVVLDGELVAFDGEGRPSFQRLQSRMHLSSESAVRRKARDVPVAYVVFDLLYVDGRSTTALTYAERRELLHGLELSGPSWQAPPHYVGEGAALLEASRQQALEGVIAKRLDSPYEPGRRSRAWLKIKNHEREALVVGGWLPGAGGRRGRLGALLVGFHDEGGALRYAGRVGTGFTESELERLGGLLEPLARRGSPFSGRQPPREARFVEPRLVAEVEFREWTQTSTLRAPAYKGLRDDIAPERVALDPRSAG